MGAEAEADGLRQVFAAAPKARELIAGLFADIRPISPNWCAADPRAHPAPALSASRTAQFRSLLAHNVDGA